MNGKKMLLRILVTAVLTLVFHFLPVEGVLRFLLYLALYLFIACDVLKEAFESIKDGGVFDETFLMSVATVGALIVGLVYTGDYAEAIAVMLFYQIGEFLQDYAVDKSTDSISALMDIRPDYANVLENGVLKKVSPSEVPIGTLITVLPGEKIPLDGTVTGGSSALNTSALTGESLPKDVEPGDIVVSGCVNISGVIEVRTAKAYGDSTVSKILELAQNASERKSKAEGFITRFARIYTPAVCIGAVLLAVVPPIINLIAGADAGFNIWIYRALAFLVASCPCALVVSIPLSFFAAIGGASKEGILIKGATYLEALSKADCVAFDKTGTLTKGVFEVTDIVPDSEDLSKELLLEYAALAESASTHPIGKSILRAYGKDVDVKCIENFKEHSALGVTAKVNGASVAVGGAKFMAHLGIKCSHGSSDGTDVHVAVNENYAGRIVVSDVLKPSSEEAVAALYRVGVSKAAMLTGDSEKTAKTVAEKLNINSVFSELMPADKVAKLEALKGSAARGKTLVFAGDGINDTPVLAAADVGIAMGALGSDAAIEAADVVLMDDDPRKIAKAIRISRKCMRIVRQNTVLAIAVKLAVLILAAAGLANMWMAVFADVGITVIAVLNAMRALFVKKV